MSESPDSKSCHTRTHVSYVVESEPNKLFPYLDDPLGVLQAQVTVGALVAEAVGDGLAGGEILKGGGTGGLAGSDDGGFDRLTRGDGKIVESD